MKKTNKIVAVVIAALLVVAALVVLAACGKTYTGEVSYVSWGTNYGVKVDVTVKGDVITAVKLYTDEESELVRTSKSWTENQHPGDLGFEKAEAAYEGWIEENLVGASVEKVLGWSAMANADDQKVGEGVPHIAGATQSSARIICAVQEALCQLPGVEKVTGEVTADKRAGRNHEYYVKVDVIVKDGKILNAKVYAEDEEHPMTSTGWGKHDEVNGAILAFVAEKVVGQTVEAVNAWTYDFTQKGAAAVGEGVPHITGGTETSAHIIAAIQNALSKLGK